MANNEDLFKKITSHAKEYGFIFPSSEIYDGMSAVYDYGQNGVELKNNIKQYWWKSMTQMHENIVGIDSAIFMHPTIWKASGHVDAFNDPLIDNKDSKKRYRADVLIEEHIAKIEDKINKECEKAKKKFGDAFDREQFVSTNARVLEYASKMKDIQTRFASLMEANDLAGIKALIEELGIVCPISGSRNWTDVRQFNLMFATKVGSVSEQADTIYLRPETAQGIFVNYLNVQKTGRMKIPFGIAQIGKAFRNEIVARQFIFRMREFEQMEMQFFVRPGEEIKWFEYWKETRMKWHLALGIPSEKYRYHDHEKLAHYANAATDIEFEFPFGFKELEGIHSRTDFDLKRHQEFSGKKLQYFDSELGESYVPYVIETSIGLDRTFLAVFSHAYKEEKLEDGSERVVLALPRVLAPVKAAVLPLVKKDGMPKKAREIMNILKQDFQVQYDEKDAIGKRYRRQDAIGTPYCITVDSQTMEDNTVTIRERDTMQQERISIDNLFTYIHNNIKPFKFIGMKSKYILLILAFVLVINPCKKAKAQGEYIVPATLISYGVLAQFVPALDDFDLNIREGFSSFNQNKCKVDDYIQYLPTLAFAGLGTLGVETNYKFVDRLCVGAIAYTLVGATVLITKQATGIKRPDGSANNSFPSGHTALSFVGADLVYQTYKDSSPIYGIVAYTCATTVGFLRMYNNRHWFSDVVCGAGVGILASRLSFWAFDKIKQCLNKNNNKNLSFNGGFSPFVYQDKIGLSLSLSF